MKKIETRTYVAKGIEARDDSGVLTLCGYAAMFDSPSYPLPFVETIQRGAFTKTLSESPDVRLLINHDGLPLARTKSGTLTLTEDELGLYFVASLPDTQEARDLHTLVSRKDIDQMSFAFRVIRQVWSDDRQKRLLTEISLQDGDVSVVTYPAYAATSAEARSMKDKVESTLSKLNSFQQYRAAENQPGKQVAFTKALEGLAELIQIEAGELKDGENEMYSLESLLNAVESLLTWQVDENWEWNISPVATNEVEPRKISLRLAQAINNQ